MAIKEITLNSSTQKWTWFIIITLQNIIAMFERVSFTTILEEISKDLCDHKCSNSKLGFIQTFYFIMTFTSSPLLGYLGDRWSRKYLLIIGLFIWAVCVLVMTFIPSYWPFVIVNGFSAIGIVIYFDLAPTILADLFSEQYWPIVYGVYFLSIPFGLGIGMLVTRALTNATGDWRNCLRLTPGMTILAAITVFLVLVDPPRGGSDVEIKNSCSSCWSDIKYMFSVKTFVLHIIGFTCQIFFGTGWTFWSPTLFRQSVRVYENHNGKGTSPVTESDVTYIQAILLIAGGAIGILLGSSLSAYLRDKYNRFDPLLIGGSLLLSLPFVCASGFIADKNIVVSFVLLSFYMCVFHVSLSIAMDMAVSVILPSKRVFSLSMLMTVQTALGATISPYITGQISELLNPTESKDDEIQLKALQLSFIPMYILLCISGICYIIASFFIVKDKEAADKGERSIEDKVAADKEHHLSVDKVNMDEEKA